MQLVSAAVDTCSVSRRPLLPLQEPFGLQYMQGMVLGKEKVYAPKWTDAHTIDV